MARIDTLTPGTQVRLRFHEGAGKAFEDDFYFKGIKGEGDDREALFGEIPGTRIEAYDAWSAYRYKGNWAYGSSADRLSLVSILLPAPVS